MDVRLGRIRDAGADDPGGGVRVLVDRLWPRGLAKHDAPHDEWVKAVAPSSALRRWFGHDPERFAEFARRYRAELEGSPDAVEALERLRAHAVAGPLTLLTATRDLDVSHVRVLADVLTEG